MIEASDVKFSIVLPALNEQKSLEKLLPELKSHYPNAEVLVIDDGSIDDTTKICQAQDVRVISHPYCMGNGASIKTGVRNVSHEIIVFMDADGQHSPEDITALLNKLLNDNYDMVIGARRPETHATLMKRIGNTVFNNFASLMTGRKIVDLTSGFRATRASVFKKFVYLLPNGFSYPTTSTMAYLRSGHPVGFVSIYARDRMAGTTSNIRALKDGVKFLIIITKVGALFSPMRFFLPISLAFFMTGLAYYGYTFFMYNRFTNMSALLFIASLMIFLIGILSEQVSSLHYRDSSH